MIPALPDLLERSSFTLRGRRRAMCPYCSGHDRTTVSFNYEVAHCHRCHWSSGRIKLARELGLLDPEKLTPSDKLQIIIEERRARLREEFRAWKNVKTMELFKELDALRFRARFAHQVLILYPEETLAWQALANFYHNERRIYEQLDFHEGLTDKKELVKMFASHCSHVQTSR
jgi:hypothetical protein